MSDGVLRRPSNVKGLLPRLPVRGKIKIGIKGEMIQSRNDVAFQPPRKLDHFVITTMQRGADGNYLRDEEMHKRFGDKPTKLPVRLLYNDINLNFQSTYSSYLGRSAMFCRGDGETAMQLKNVVKEGKLLKAVDLERIEVECPCFRLDPAYDGIDKCKINGILSVMIDGAPGLGGVWEFRTTSINSVQGILSSLTLIQTITGGTLAGIPLNMVLRPKATTTPQGQATTIYIVSLEYEGDTAALQEHALRLLRDDRVFYARIESIETELKKVAYDPFAEEAPEDITDEFHPEVSGAEAANKGAGAEAKPDANAEQKAAAPAPEPEPESEPKERKTRKKEEPAPAPEMKAAPQPESPKAERNGNGGGVPRIEELF